VTSANANSCESLARLTVLFFRKFPPLIQTVFSDLAVRNGIKFALAGMLALFLALLLRLDEPTWAVTTAFVLSTPKFVGAVGEKTVLRILGAIAGAVIGYLITGALQQNPALFLGAMGLLVAIGTAMYGGTFAPYGFRQCGYTATLVAAQGLANPAFSWHVGMSRCEEICLGIVVTMVVSTTVWPRFARKEFGDDVRGTLRVLAELFRQRVGAFLAGDLVVQPDVLGTVGGRLAKLRKMIRLGCMESTEFRRGRALVDDTVSQLGILSAALSNLGRALPAESLFREYIETEARALHEALAETFESLADAASTPLTQRPVLARARGCLSDYEARLLEFRLDGVGDNLTVDESLEHAGYSLSIHEIFAALARLADILPKVEESQTESFPRIRLEKFTLPDRGWIKSGIRGGLAVVIGLLLLNWLKPPGGDLLVVGAYLFTAFSLESSDRKGDLGVFTTLVAMGLSCGVFFVFLLLAAPLMASYSVLNVFLGTALFLTGYLLEAGAIGSFVTLIVMFMVVILVGLNAQQPVSFQGIVGPVLGLVLAATLSAVMRRLLWSSLPQDALRARLCELLGVLEKTASHPDAHIPVAERAEIALSAADALVLVGVVAQKNRQFEEAARLRAYIQALARLGGHLMFSTGPIKIPEQAATSYREQRANLLAAIAAQILDQQQAIEQRKDFPAAVPLPAARDWTTACRTRIRKSGGDVHQTIVALGILYRHEQSALSASAAAALASDCRCADFFSDTIL
jgi:uncharacterized membrane protein YccC